MQFLKRTSLVAGLLAAVAGTSTLSGCSPSSEAVEHNGPIKPKLGQAIQFRAHRVHLENVNKQRQPEVSIMTEQQLTFMTANKDGYVVNWKEQPTLIVAPSPIKEVLTTVFAALEKQPLVYQTDIAGRPQKLLNWDKVQPVLVPAVEQALKDAEGKVGAMSAGERAWAKETLTDIRRRFAPADLAAASETLLQEPRRIFAAVGQQGAPRTSDYQIVSYASPITGKPVSAIQRIDYLETKPGASSTQVDISTYIEPAGPERGWVQTFEGQDISSYKKANAELIKRNEPAPGFELEEKQNSLLSIADGMPKQVVFIKRLGVKAHRKYEKVTFTRAG